MASKNQPLGVYREGSIGEFAMKARGPEFKSPGQKPVMTTHAYNASIWGQSQADPRHLLASQINKTVNFQFTERPYLIKTKVDNNRKKYPVSSSDLHMLG